MSIREETNYVKMTRRQPLMDDLDGRSPFKELVLQNDVESICKRRVRDNTASAFTSLQEVEWRERKRDTVWSQGTWFYSARKD